MLLVKYDIELYDRKLKVYLRSILITTCIKIKYYKF